jgi:plasmid replication initiation protein
MQAAKKEKVITTPKVPQNLSSIVKPEELIDIVEMTPLTLADRRIYNLLLANAWNDLEAGKTYQMGVNMLEKHIDSRNQDTVRSLKRLMATLVQIKTLDEKKKCKSVELMSLLCYGKVVFKGVIEYRFTDELVALIKSSRAFARLQTDIMFQLSSKYALAMYEFLQRRCNLKYLSYEVLTIDEIRGILGVPKGKLKSFGHFNDKALKPALEEVTKLTPYQISATPIKTGAKVTALRMEWAIKDIPEEFKALANQLQATRMQNSDYDQAKPFINFTYEQAMDMAQPSWEGYAKGKALWAKANNGSDFYDLEQQYYDHAHRLGQRINDPDKAFYGFIAKRVKKKAA